MSLFETPKTKLLKALSSYLEQCPQDTKDFLDVCNKSLDIWMERQTRHNSRKAVSAVTDLIYIAKFDNVIYSILGLLKGFVIALPNGWESIDGHSTSMREAFYKFLVAAEEYGLTKPETRLWAQEQHDAGGWIKLIFDHPEYQKLKSKLSKQFTK